MKRLNYIFIAICLSLIFTTGCNKIEEKQISEQKEVSEQNTVVEKSNNHIISTYPDKEEAKAEQKTIVIDPGHSSVGNKEKEQIAPNSIKTKAKDVLGATGQYTKVPEYKTTVSIGLLLKEELESRGYKVVMTKDEVSESLSNIDRATIGNENNADLVVRVHADSSESNDVNGASILVPAKNNYTEGIVETSEIYGNKIIEIYTKEMNIKNRGIIHREDMTGFNWSKVPVVILEMGFLSNKEEDLFISNIKNHTKIAKSIANGVDSCFE